MESAEDDDDLSILDYARSHGICVNYNSEQPHLGDLPVPSDEAIDQDLRDLFDSQITANATSQLIKERLAVTKDAAFLLKSIHTLPEVQPSHLLATDRLTHVLRLKQELPVLSTDNELDMLKFGNATLPDFKRLRIPTELTNEENDEGFGWASKYFAFPAQCDERVKLEKLAVSRDALVQLQDAIRDTYTPEDSEHIKFESLAHKPNTTLRPLTPPLLPLSPPLTPYVPSSPANRLPLPSDSTDSITAEAKNLERQIMALDPPDRGSDSGDSMLLDITDPSELDALFEVEESLTLKRRVSDLKVEGPLTPPMFTSSPFKKLKSVSFAKTLQEFIPIAPPAGGSIDEDEQEDIDEYFRDLEPLAMEAQRKVENEQLSGADTTARVDIPAVDFSLPVAPWDEYSHIKNGKHGSSSTELDAQMMFLSRTKREDLKSAVSWYGFATLERELRWNIFTTKLTSVDLKETLHGEAEWIKILAEMTTSSITTSDSQVWKREGLRVLDEEEDEEEVEADEFEDVRDVETLVRKRKLEIEEEEEEAAEVRSKRTVPNSVLPTSILPLRKPLESHHWKETKLDQQTPPKMSTGTTQNEREKPRDQLSAQKDTQASTNTGGELMFGGFSATTALHRFMETRGKPKEARENSQPAQNQLPTLKSQLRSIASKRASYEPSAVTNQQNPAQIQQSNLQKQLPVNPLPDLPIISSNLAPSSFILCSTLLHRRNLVKQIEHLYPTAETIYRDYMLPHSASPEADILLSPATGLIFTTLQQLKQRALPGQPDRSPIKERINALQYRCERLLVMVSEGLSREMEDLGSSRPEDERDKLVLSQFEAFAEKMEGEVLVRYVRGGEKALAHAVVVEMERFGLVHGSEDIGDIKPLAVETTWETFLRRAGLNPFAAQVIIASLKHPFDVQIPASLGSPASLSQHIKSVSVSGLPAFMVMHAEERVRCFQAVMGGSRILKRVGRVLDQEWVSAVNGFRL